MHLESLWHARTQPQTHTHTHILICRKIETFPSSNSIIRLKEWAVLPSRFRLLFNYLRDAPHQWKQHNRDSFADLPSLDACLSLSPKSSSPVCVAASDHRNWWGSINPVKQKYSFFFFFYFPKVSYITIYTNVINLSKDIVGLLMSISHLSSSYFHFTYLFFSWSKTSSAWETTVRILHI